MTRISSELFPDTSSNLTMFWYNGVVRNLELFPWWLILILAIIWAWALYNFWKAFELGPAFNKLVWFYILNRCPDCKGKLEKKGFADEDFHQAWQCTKCGWGNK